MKNQAERTTPDGLLELVGAPPIWLWAHPCRLADCDCRLALILATPEGRAALTERSAGVHKAWHEGADCAQVASRLTDLAVFQVHIDSAEAFLLDAQTPLDLANHPQVRVVLDRLDGEVLDAIGHFYDRSRGKEDRAARVASADKIVLQGWSRGDMVEYGSLAGARRDLYRLDGKQFEAHESYCPTPKCACGEVVVAFEPCQPEGATEAGYLTVRRSSAVQFSPIPGAQDQLDRLWSAFRQRHPLYRQRFARRDAWIKSLGDRLVTDSAPAPIPTRSSVGRNDPCPCGSGNKYKKCCAATQTSGAALLTESSA